MKNLIFKELLQAIFEMIGYIVVSLLIGLCVVLTVNLDAGCTVSIVLIVAGIVKQFFVTIKEES